MKYKPKFFFEEQDDNHGGGGDVEPQLDTMADAPLEEQDDSGQQQQTTTPPAFDPAAFAKTLGESVTAAITKSQPPQQKQEAKQLTPEEAKKALNVWEPDDEFLKEFGNLETQKGAMGKLRDALIKQADTITQVRLQQMHEHLEAKYAPIVAAMEAREGQERTARFDSSYQQLADPGLRPLIGALTQQLASEGKTFTSEGELFKEVATRAEAVIKTTNPAFKLSASAPKKSSGIPVTTPGAGGGGGGGTRSGATSKSTVLSVLGDLD